MRLIDVDKLKADYGMAEDCKDCKTGYRSCQYDNTYTKMNFCGWLDDAETVDAIPINWIMTQVEERVERGTAFDISVASILRTMVKEWRDEQTD